jgi:DNA processing protein
MTSEHAAWVTLASVDGIGPATFGRLLAAFGDAETILDAARRGRLDGELRERERGARGEPARDLGAALIEAIGVAARRPAAIVERLEALDIEAVTLRDAAYPERLRGLEDAPPVLFVRGAVAALSGERSVAVVGTRRPTPAGRAFAGAAAAAIASSGAVVVSGLAFGIDAAAHAAVAEQGDVTVAVIGSGLGILRPVAHRRLARAIIEAGGAIVSEQRVDATPVKGTYPRRNRLIAALSEAVVVVEAPARSGALNTAGWAAGLGLDLYVVPGRPWEPTTAGCVALLHDVPGARAVVDVPTLLTDLELGTRDGEPAARVRTTLGAVLVGLSPIEAALARRLRRGPASPDRLAVDCGLPVEQVAGGLSLLELRGYAWSSGPLYLAGGALRDAG